MNQQKYFNCDKDKRIVQKKNPIILIIAPIKTHLGSTIGSVWK